ncbi:MAG: hypothetical protein A3K09_01290 [Nitrospinae bacterium RIFCSPLOWO2_12_FULL_47_7]|nr:MAG: hypothetical protein A3K09_01290 [Nitrospinae bacterium RIFCSPLOWO2_12_FULL_47_7]
MADFCIKHEIGIIAYSPLASGILSGKYTKDAKFTDWRSRGASPHFKEGTYEKLIEKTDKLKEYAGASGKTIIELALAWVMAKPGIVAAIGGANTPEQIEANVKAMEWELTDEEVMEIEEIVEQ